MATKLRNRFSQVALLVTALYVVHVNVLLPVLTPEPRFGFGPHRPMFGLVPGLILGIAVAAVLVTLSVAADALAARLR